MSDETGRADGGAQLLVKLPILLFGVAIGVVATLTFGRFDPNGTNAVPAPASPPAGVAALITPGATFPLPDAGSGTGAASGLPTVDAMAEKLKSRLATAPDDPEGWRMLGWTYLSLGRLDESVAAYREAASRAPVDANILASLGEVLVRKSGGEVTSEARDLFDRAAGIDTAEPRARFFLGLAKSQAGDPAGAIEDWLALIRDSAPDAPYTAEVRTRIAELAQSSGIDLGDRLAALPAETTARGPSAEQVREAENMSAADRQAMIRNMVAGLEARLAEDPGDPDGWVRLIRSWVVLGEREKAEKALAGASAAFAADADTRQAIVDQAMQLGVVLR